MIETPEMKQLFDEWMEGLRKKLLILVEEKHEPAGLAAALGISEKAVRSLILLMAREGDIRISGVQGNNSTTGGKNDG